MSTRSHTIHRSEKPSLLAVDLLEGKRENYPKRKASITDAVWSTKEGGRANLKGSEESAFDKMSIRLADLSGIILKAPQQAAAMQSPQDECEKWKATGIVANPVVRYKMPTVIQTTRSF